jgi:hypothetical protein
VDEDRALEVLGLDAGADLRRVKRAFRTLAHDVHPDRGGDPRAFHDLHVAYRSLVARLERPDGPRASRVARGRPSRDQRAEVDMPASTGPLVHLSVQERSALTSARGAAVTLDAETLARLLLDGDVRLASRAPGSLTNRFSTLLDTGTTSILIVSTTRAELTARSRAARRAVTALDLSDVMGAAWSRRRGDALTVLTASLVPSATVEVGGAGDDADAGRLRAASHAVVALLDALAWPLGSWRIDPVTR